MITTRYCPPIFSIPAKICLLSAAVFALCLEAVEAAGPESAPNWDVSGEWQLSQKAEKLVTMNLNQTGNQFTGTASIGTTPGKVVGFVSGDAFTAKVTWVATIVTKKESVSNYTGTINENGIIKGNMNPGDSKWRSEGFSSLTAMKRLQPTSTENGAESAPESSTSTATSSDEPSSSDSDDSHKRHKKHHKHHHHDDRGDSRRNEG